MAERKGSIDWLKGKLYSRKDDVSTDPDNRTPLSENQTNVPVSWNESLESSRVQVTSLLNMASTKKGWSVATKFLIASFIFFIIATGAAVYLFFYGDNGISPQNIDVQIVMPSVVDGGKVTNLQIIATNRNQANLKLVDLIINYPEGTRDASNPDKSLSHERQNIGAVAAGQTIQRTSQAIFYGQEGQSQKVSVQLEYTVEGSNAVFERDADISFTVGSSPVSISISAPTEAISDQQFAFDVTVQSNALSPVQDVVVQARYPFGFSVSATSPQAQVGGTLWRLGEMKPGESQVLRITGSLNGQDGDTRVFYFLAGSDADKTNTTVRTPFLSIPQTLTVRRPFIAAQLSINGQTGKTISVPAGADVQGVITWTNNLPDPVADVQISLLLSGPTLDTTSIKAPTGFYQSSDSTLTWTKDQNQQLGSVPPGGTGTLPFSFKAVPSGSGGTLYSNPAISLNVKVEGVRQGQTNVPQNVTSAASTQVYVSSMATLSATASHFTGGFSNSGPMPPVPGQNTTYTVNWVVTNTANTIANAVVSATLPPYVSFVTAQAGSGISYDSGSRTVTWKMGDVKAGAGFTAPSRTVSFQVSLLPSSSQSGQSPSLTSQASFSGQDRFAQVQVNTTANGPTTQLSEAGYSSNMGVVQ
ncbi:DUF11 domain-containing protein [Patescibacteria group bacterium]|nr:DUF11 domain-containing protein [Patescibacteria group bacterium]